MKKKKNNSEKKPYVKKYDRPGAPTKYRRDFHCQDFINLSKVGKTLAQIALAWDVDRDTVQEWARVHPEFSASIKKGRQYAESWYMNIGHSAMLGQVKVDGQKVNFNLGMFCWLTKNMFKWSDRVEHSEKPKKRRPLKNVSDEELDDL